MTTKIKTITLRPGYRSDSMSINDPTGYRVERVTDSLEFTPGNIITRKQADELCDSNYWKVTIVGTSH